MTLEFTAYRYINGLPEEHKFQVRFSPSDPFEIYEVRMDGDLLVVNWFASTIPQMISGSLIIAGLDDEAYLVY